MFNVPGALVQTSLLRFKAIPGGTQRSTEYKASVRSGNIGWLLDHRLTKSEVSLSFQGLPIYTYILTIYLHILCETYIADIVEHICKTRGRRLKEDTIKQ